MSGCIAYINLAETRFSQPLPWIGLYVAGASLLCGLAMGADAYRGFSKLKAVWFPPKYFALNSLTLTLLGVAAKLPVDLNTSMPGSWDQLTKLCGTVLTCTLMANFIHSLGSMSNSDILSNVIALAIPVITIIVNMIMQMCTGLIYVFLPEHVTILFIMLMLLVLLASSALIVPTTKEILNDQFDQRSCEIQKNTDKSPEKIKEDIRKFWMLLHSSNPQFVIGRSPTCMASAALCLASTLILTEAMVRSFFTMKFPFCAKVKSDYRWSIMVVLIAQAVAVVVGTILPVVRWFCVIKLKHPAELLSSTCRDVFKVEEYWIKRLKELKRIMERKEDPDAQNINGARWWMRRLENDSKDVGIAVGIAVLVAIQKGVVVASKVMSVIWMVPISWLSTSSIGNTDMVLRDYVLHLEGENDLVPTILKSCPKDTETWIETGKKNKPTALKELITKHSSVGKGVKGFITTLIGSQMEFYYVLHCWSLSIVTLAIIAVELPGIEKSATESLLKSVSEGLKYVRLVETQFCGRELRVSRDVADMILHVFDVYRKKICNSRLHDQTEAIAAGYISFLRSLDEKAEEYVSKFVKRNERNSELVANSMQGISRAILKNFKNGKTNKKLFKWIRKRIAESLIACLTNLPRVIYEKIFDSPIQEREKVIRDAALLLGEAEELLTKLSASEIANKEYIKSWTDFFLPTKK